MAKRMEGKPPKPCQLQNLVVLVCKGARLHIAAHGIRHDHTCLHIPLPCYLPFCVLSQLPLHEEARYNAEVALRINQKLLEADNVFRKAPDTADVSKSP